MNEATVGAVILGAGFSRRFGRADKRLARVGNQRLADATVKTYRSVFSEVRVVLREGDTALASDLSALAVDVIHAPDAASGMGHSLAAGVQGLTWTWTFVALLDMPFVQPATLQTLVSCALDAQEHVIVRPQLRAHPEEPAHPIGFHQSLLPALGQTRGDAGARRLLKEDARKVLVVPLDDVGLVRDIDTPEDLDAD